MARAFCWIFALLLLLACSTEEPAQVAAEPRAWVQVQGPTRPPAPEPGTAVAHDLTPIERVITAQRALASHEVEMGDPPDVFQIPAPARPHLEKLKQAWLDSLTAVLPALLARHPSDPKLSAALTALLKSRGVAEGYEAQGFGSLLDIQARRHPGELLGVVITTSLSCGSDASLFLFSTQAGPLRHVLTAAADQHVSLADGQLALDYALVPSADGGDPEVVVASVTPWCSSAWRTVRYAVLAPTADPSRPTRRLSREASIWIGNGSTRIETGPDWFQVRYDTWDKLGAGATATALVSFRRHQTKWRPSAPRVRDADALLHAWARLPARLAEQLVLPEARAEAAKLHARFNAAGGSERGGLSLEAQGQDRARVAFECEDCTKLPRAMTFSLERRAGQWRIAAVKP